MTFKWATALWQAWLISNTDPFSYSCCLSSTLTLDIISKNTNLWSHLCYLLLICTRQFENYSIQISYFTKGSVYVILPVIISGMRMRRWFPHISWFANTSIVTLVVITCVSIYITLFRENGIGRQIAQQSTLQMQHLLMMINFEYEKDQSIFVEVDSF